MAVSARSELLHLIRQRQVVGEAAAVVIATFQVSKLLRAASTVGSLKLKIKSLEGAEAERVLALGSSQFAIVTHVRRLARLEQTLRKLDEFLEMRRIGHLDRKIFELPKHSHQIFAALEGTEEDEPQLPAADDSRPRDVDYLIAIELILRSADISNLVRERPVYRFSKTGEATLIQRELVVDIAEIGRIAKVNIRKKPWLLSEVTRVIDFRIMSHVLHEPNHSKSDISINFHTDTVLSPEFEDFVNRLDSTTTSLPSIEFDLAELKAYPEIAKLAIKRLKDAGWRIVIDGISVSHLVSPTEPLPPIAGVYKFDWRNVWPLEDRAFDAAATAKLIAKQLDRLGRENCVLQHCHVPAVIENGLRLGFTQLEGFEIARYLAAKPKAKTPVRVPSEKKPQAA